MLKDTKSGNKYVNSRNTKKKFSVSGQFDPNGT